MAALALVGKTKRQKGCIRMIDSFRQKVYLIVVVPNTGRTAKMAALANVEIISIAALDFFLRKVAEIVALAKEENKERISKVV